MQLKPLEGGMAGGGMAGRAHLVASHRAEIGEVASDQESIEAQLASLHGHMQALQPSMAPFQRDVIHRERRALASSEKLDEAVRELREALLKNLPNVIERPRSHPPVCMCMSTPPMCMGVCMQVTELFRSFDINGDGLVSKTEFRQVLPRIRLALHGCVHPLMCTVNAQVLPVLSGTPQFGRAELDALFEAIDVDGSGTVELKELHKLLRKGADVQLSAVMQVQMRVRVHLRLHMQMHMCVMHLHLACVTCTSVHLHVQCTFMCMGSLCVCACGMEHGHGLHACVPCRRGRKAPSRPRRGIATPCARTRATAPPPAPRLRHRWRR